jgi:hypothetical protein
VLKVSKDHKVLDLKEPKELEDHKVLKDLKVSKDHKVLLVMLEI